MARTVEAVFAMAEDLISRLNQWLLSTNPQDARNGGYVGANGRRHALRQRSNSTLSRFEPDCRKCPRASQNPPGHSVQAARKLAWGYPIAYEPEGKLPRRSKLNGGDEFKVVTALKGKER